MRYDPVIHIVTIRGVGWSGPWGPLPPPHHTAPLSPASQPIHSNTPFKMGWSYTHSFLPCRETYSFELLVNLNQYTLYNLNTLHPSLFYIYFTIVCKIVKLVNCLIPLDLHAVRMFYNEGKHDMLNKSSSVQFKWFTMVGEEIVCI